MFALCFQSPLTAAPAPRRCGTSRDYLLIPQGSKSMFRAAKQVTGRVKTQTQDHRREPRRLPYTTDPNCLSQLMGSQELVNWGGGGCCGGRRQVPRAEEEGHCRGQHPLPTGLGLPGVVDGTETRAGLPSGHLRRGELQEHSQWRGELWGRHGLWGSNRRAVTWEGPLWASASSSVRWERQYSKAVASL